MTSRQQEWMTTTVTITLNQNRNKPRRSNQIKIWNQGVAQTDSTEFAHINLLGTRNHVHKLQSTSPQQQQLARHGLNIATAIARFKLWQLVRATRQTTMTLLTTAIIL